MTQKPLMIQTELEKCTKALLVGVYFATKDKTLCQDSIDELQGLCKTYGLEVTGQILCPLKKIDAGTFLGKGKIDEIIALAKDIDAGVIIFDDEISPNQQRNLEKMCAKPVIDRAELIIEVFAQRAQTHEARLQVKLAKIKYQYPRLKRLWTHLSRQSAGSATGGHLKGEGEKQIELDRRLLKSRIEQLQKEIEEVQEKRQTQRASRLRAHIPSFAIVGYTNAGKSTLLNALTEADVLVEDKLFATLDTTTRQFLLPNKQEVLLIDTVGFIKKIPHTLIAAFKGTLEEAAYTDILIHLIDASNPQALLQAEATEAVLKELSIDKPVIVVFNKVDKCQDSEALGLLKEKYISAIEISAREKKGLTLLIDAMIRGVSSLRKAFKVRIPQENYALISELMGHGRVLSRDYVDNDVLLEVEVPTQLEHKIRPYLYEI